MCENSRDRKDYEIFYPENAVPTDWYPSNVKPAAFLELIKSSLVDYTWSANSLRTMLHLYRGKKNGRDNKTISVPVPSGYFTTDTYSVDGAMYYVDKLFFEIPDDYLKSIIIIPTLKDMVNIKNGQKYIQLDWYSKINEIAKKYNAKFIDMANINTDYKSMYLKCDNHWNKKGNEVALEMFTKGSHY